MLRSASHENSGTIVFGYKDSNVIRAQPGYKYLHEILDLDDRDKLQRLGSDAPTSRAQAVLKLWRWQYPDGDFLALQKMGEEEMVGQIEAWIHHERQKMPTSHDASAADAKYQGLFHEHDSSIVFGYDDSNLTKPQLGYESLREILTLDARDVLQRLGKGESTSHARAVLDLWRQQYPGGLFWKLQKMTTEEMEEKVEELVQRRGRRTSPARHIVIPRDCALPSDVVLGQGGKENNRYTNVLLRSLLRHDREAYVRAGRRDKDAVARRGILRFVRSIEHGVGRAPRFLRRRCRQGNTLEVMTPDEILEYVRKRLSEKRKRGHHHTESHPVVLPPDPVARVPADWHEHIRFQLGHHSEWSDGSSKPPATLGSSTANEHIHDRAECSTAAAARAPGLCRGGSATPPGTAAFLRARFPAARAAPDHPSTKPSPNEPLGAKTPAVAWPVAVEATAVRSTTAESFPGCAPEPDRGGSAPLPGGPAVGPAPCFDLDDEFLEAVGERAIV